MNCLASFKYLASYTFRLHPNTIYMINPKALSSTESTDVPKKSWKGASKTNCFDRFAGLKILASWTKRKCFPNFFILNICFYLTLPNLTLYKMLAKTKKESIITIVFWLVFPCFRIKILQSFIKSIFNRIKVWNIAFCIKQIWKKKQTTNTYEKKAEN